MNKAEAIAARLMVKGLIAELPGDGATKVQAAVDDIKKALAAHDPSVGLMAVSLIATEMGGDVLTSAG